MSKNGVFLFVGFLALLLSACGPTVAPPDVGGSCVVDNGGCGDAKYFRCTETATGAVDCADLDECSVNNGGCGSPTDFFCINQVGAEPNCVQRASGGTDAGTTDPNTNGGQPPPPPPPGTDAGTLDDAGNPIDPNVGCGGVTEQGQCSGNVLQFCNAQNELTSIDCATEYFPAGVAGGTCVFISSDYGFDCASPAGTSCVYQGPAGEPMPTFCASDTDGCVADLNGTAGFVCESNVPACTPPPAGAAAEPVCNGNLLVLSCLPGNQPLALDCGSAGGTCQNGACQAPVNAACDNSLIVCGDGLTCDGATATSDGTCVDVDECEIANGGCGDPAEFTCTNRVAAAPQCTPVGGNPPADCNGIGADGRCDGNVLQFCNAQNQLVTVDCETEYFPADQAGGRCLQIDSEYGYDCALPTEGSCVFSDATGQLLPTFCANPNDGCVLDLIGDQGFVCTADVAVCEQAPAGQTFAPTCNGDNLVLDCLPGDQPLAMNCGSNGGNCQDDVCQAPVDASCDGTLVVCAAGLSCEGATDSESGTCVDIDECAVANGGCGDPADFTCTNQVGAAPRCEPVGGNPPVACNGIDAAGTCDGTVLEFCSAQNELIRIDCATEYFPANQRGGRCVLIDADYGFDCALPTDESCVFEDDAGELLSTFCANPNDGCVLDLVGDQGFVCTADVGACTQPAAGQAFVPVCEGNRLFLDCLPGDQPFAYDCASNGGICQDGACRSPLAEICTTEGLVCQSGLECVGETPDDFGSCADVDACAADNGGCGNPAFWSCVDQVAAAPQCIDIKECDTNNGNCGDPTFWQCQEKDGALPECEDINECDTDNGGCGDPALFKCTNRIGARPLCQDIASGQNQACEGLTPKGECDGDVLRYCGRNGQPVTLDCRTEYFPAEYTAGTCQLIEGDYGYDCVLPAGDPCVFDNGLTEIPTLCASPTAGCVWDFAEATGFLCTETAPVCEQPPDGQVYIPQCSGDLLFLNCLPGDQPLAYDCGSLGGTCQNHVCKSPQDQICDGESLRCADGTACQGVTADAFGTCVPVVDCNVDNGGCGNAALVQCVVNDGAPTCVDVDECATNNGGCGDPQFVRCLNREAAAPICEDINECATNNGGCGDPNLYSCTNRNAGLPLCQDKNTGVDPVCNGITAKGQCDGNVLSYCNGNDTRVTVDCPTEFLPEVGTGASCVLVDSDFGYDCAFPTGETCLQQTDQNSIPISCSNDNDGCILDVVNNANFVCTANVPTCTPAAANEVFTPTCGGDFLFVACLAGSQPLGYDCAANTGVCTDGACRVAPNGFCDEAIYRCEAGLTCQGLTAEVYGRCVAP